MSTFFLNCGRSRVCSLCVDDVAARYFSSSALPNVCYSKLVCVSTLSWDCSLTLGACTRVVVVILCVCVCVCVSVTELHVAATYLIYSLKVRCH